jgi:phosphoribosylformylglycinamidine synthase I
VLGSCNGFQILCEAGMLPGVLLRNDHLQFRCDWQWLRVERPVGAWLSPEEVAAGEVIRLPISHGEGRYHAEPSVLAELDASGRVALRYSDLSGAVVPDANPNGSAAGIAGLVNPRGNVLGLMPHPERAADPEVGGTDGLRLLRSLDRWLAAQAPRAERAVEARL